MRGVGVVVLVWCAGCFIDPERSIDLTRSTPETCIEMPATCGTDVLGSWTTDQDCSLDANTLCAKWDWSFASVGPLTLRFNSNGTVDLRSFGHYRATIAFDRACSTASETCAWTSGWGCMGVGQDCQCTFDKIENVSGFNYYTLNDGYIDWEADNGVYKSERYCVDGDYLYLLYDDGAYLRFKRD